MTRRKISVDDLFIADYRIEIIDPDGTRWRSCDACQSLLGYAQLAADVAPMGWDPAAEQWECHRCGYTGTCPVCGDDTDPEYGYIDEPRFCSQACAVESRAADHAELLID